jgi:hypothetical protein
VPTYSRLAELTSDFPVHYPYQQGLLSSPLFDLLWRGGKWGGVDIGPISGHADRVFRSMMTAQVQNDLAVLKAYLMVTAENGIGEHSSSAQREIVFVLLSGYRLEVRASDNLGSN